MIRKHGVTCDICSRRAYVSFKRLPEAGGFLIVCKKCKRDMKLIQEAKL